MKLFIVEDEVILIDKYQTYFRDLFDTIQIAHDFNTAYSILKNHQFDIYLLDYNLPDGNGLDLTTLYRENTDAVTVVITGYSKEKIAIRSLNLGVFRYIEKPVQKALLIQVMKEAVAEAQKRASLKSLQDQFSINRETQMKLRNDFFLSEREVEVLQQTLVYGKNKIVGEKLNLSAGTVRNHLSNIYQKLHIESKDELKHIIQRLNSKQKILK